MSITILPSRLTPTTWIIKKDQKICVTFQRAGIHRYPDAPDDVAYLKLEHRHLFKFKVSITVKHQDREIEFHQFLNWLESLYASGTLLLDHKSCEMISDDLFNQIHSKYSKDRTVIIEVWEDGECGSITEYQPRTES